MTFFLLCSVALFAVAWATNPSISVVQSLDKQLVQVARVDQPYTWTFSAYTFSSSDGPVTFTTSLLPPWLTFDNTSRTFSGTPSANDEGYPEITVTGHAASSSTSSRFSICVTHLPPPTLRIPLSDQFQPNASSLSSVFFLRTNSAIATGNPAVRVPLKWSFSIGIQTSTFQSDRSIYYELRLANSSMIPNFMSFNSKTATLDGVTPSPDVFPEPLVLPFSLHASDQEGYTAASLPFDLIVADHELSRTTDTLPTINVTTETAFVISLLSSVDFMGILVDGDPIQPSNISRLDVDVSSYSSWLRYDVPSRTLSGKPPANNTDTPTLPVILETTFNQTLRTQVSLALVESYFVMSDLPSIHVSRGDQIVFDLSQWFSPSRANPGYDRTNLSASFEPTASANWLRFDESTSNLTGNVPETYESTTDRITITFTAYSRETRSTSHATLSCYIVNNGNNGNTNSLAPTHPKGLSTEAHRKLVLAIALTFGILGGMCMLAGLFAIVRRWARIEDTAIVGEEGRHALSEKDRRWYGLTLSPNGTRIVEKNDHGGFPSPMRKNTRSYSPLGLNLRRVSERSQQLTASNEELLSPGVMSKKEFLARIKETVRRVSDKYGRRNHTPTIRPVIGKPILLASSRVDDHAEHIVPSSPSNPFDDLGPISRPGSTFISGSPSASTAEHSIPRRRADFGSPKNVAQVHFSDGLLVRQVSTGSMGATSFRSGLSGNSYGEVPMGPPTRPRLVPFTPSTRVPVPQVMVHPMPGASGGFPANRITSQKANVILEEGVKPSASSDALTMGIHYVRSLGADQLTVSGGGRGSGSSPALSNVRSSFASLESSHLGHKSGTDVDMMRVLVRAGERFKFRVPIQGKRTKGYFVKLTSGQPLPKFIHADLNGISTNGALEFSGVATFHELGERNVGIYAEKDGACVASVIIEVVGKR